MDLRCCSFWNSRTRPLAARSALLGTHPRFTQVPPMSCPSITATFSPCRNAGRGRHASDEIHPTPLRRDPSSGMKSRMKELEERECACLHKTPPTSNEAQEKFRCLGLRIPIWDARCMTLKLPGMNEVCLPQLRAHRLHRVQRRAVAAHAAANDHQIIVEFARLC